MAQFHFVIPAGYSRYVAQRLAELRREIRDNEIQRSGNGLFAKLPPLILESEIDPSEGDEVVVFLSNPIPAVSPKPLLSGASEIAA